MDQVSSYLLELKSLRDDSHAVKISTSLSARSLEGLCNELARSRNILRLKLELTECEDSGAAHMAKLLGSKSLKYLTISANNFSAKTAMVLSDALKGSSVVSFSMVATQLDSHDKVVGNEGAKYFSCCLKTNPSLKSFSLKQHCVSNEGLYSIVSSLKSNNNLESLNLSSNVFDSQGAAAIGKFLRETSTLKVLKLNDMPQLGDTGAREIASGLPANRSLQVLHLRSCGISTVGGKHLASALSSNSTLQVLHLCGNTTLGGSTVELLCRMMKKNPTLTTLHLSSCGVQDEGATHIADLLMTNASLNELTLGHNDITDAGAIQLAEALMKNKSLVQLSVEGNRFGMNAIRQFTASLQHNTTLTAIDLGSSPAEGISTAGIDALVSKNAELAHYQAVLEALQKENSKLLQELSDFKMSSKQIM